MVSVIIPVYNGEKYIKQCLDCLLTKETEELIEVIAVNDGSKDSSLALLKAYEESHKNLRVLDKENGGAAQARMLGISLARGEYIGFLDIDDKADPQMYISLEKKALECDSDIVFCNYFEVFPNKTNVVKNRFKKDQSFPLTSDDALSYMHRREAYFPFPWNKIYRADLIRSIDFPSGNFVGEDYDMQLKLIYKAKRIDHVDVEGYFYVMTVNSASRGGYSEATLRAFSNFKKNYSLVCEKHPNAAEECANYVIEEYLAMIVAMSRNKTYNKDMIKEIKRFVRSHLWGLIRASYVSLTMKGSALSLMLSYRFIVLAYRLFK